MRPRQYAKLASSNLVKNARFYIPYILAGGGLEACFYIVFTLALDNRMREVRGGSYIPGFMMFGSFITIALSFILILYANGFLMKQRKKEFGLLNVLGMEKKHVGRILLMETLISSVIAMTGGLVAGVLFYKLCTLAIAMFLKVDAVKSFYYIKAVTILPTLGLFALLYLLTYIINRVSIARMKPVELLKSDHTGEREPKIKWIFLLLGLVTLAAGYYLAISTVSPLAAINRFFIAVILVIIATYCLFITGSIAVLKFLKRKKSFYYQKNHMVAISGLMYRMKSNSVGLSSITILSCAVLVMLSTTVSLYAGIEDTLKQKFPYELYMAASYEVKKDEASTMVDVPADVLADTIEKASESFHRGECLP